MIDNITLPDNPQVTCSTKQELWYHEPEPKAGSQMTNTFTCEILSSSHCSTQTRPDCKQITWNECREKPVMNCKAKKVHVPTQELLHRKKCLLPDDVAPSSVTGQLQTIIRKTNKLFSFRFGLRDSTGRPAVILSKLVERQTS